MANLKSWGLNVVRLGMMWPGVEPTPGNYNQTYLEVMRKLVDDLHSHGIWTIVDFHQDAFAERFCGEGVPDWLLGMLEPIRRTCKGAFPEAAKIFGQCKSFEEYNYSTDPKTGFPKTEECLSVGFDMYSRTPEVTSSWGHFFALDAVQQKFRDFWSVVAKAFVGSPGVLGYDLVNEPLNGDYFLDPKLLEPGEADRRLLEPMYVSLGKVIREADPEALLIYEPAPFPDTIPAYVPLAGGVRPVGFETGPAPGEGDRQVLSYHIYSCGFATNKCDRKGDPPSAVCETCDHMADAAVTTRETDARRLGGAAFLTEFGACSGTPNCLAEIHRVADMADRSLHSWAYWQFKYNHDITTVAGPEEGFYDLHGGLQIPKVAALSRTFAPFVAGKTTSQRYDSASGAFRVTYVPEEQTRGLKTEIYYNEKLNYPRGVDVRVVGGVSEVLSQSRIEVTSQVQPGAVVDVALAPPSRLGGGEFSSKGGGLVQWKAEPANVTSFELSTASDITWWKGLKVISDRGDTVCDLQMQDATHGPLRCVLPASEQHALLFSYKIELWKAKELGIHRRVDVLDRDFFGPLLGRTVSFHWSTDSVVHAEVVI
ncbi:unnamed protein product [Symbiodinium natans]|uniref:Endoglycoceramidase n=1 Tax=Symbiodinium natans TaxID=878477 RepID=A0A812U521_9DINO|nr:unnamed protein product [Symbiodinium natans]